MIRYIKIGLVSIVLFFHPFLHAQERLTGIAGNRVLEKASRDISTQKAASVTLILPFFDDFRNASVYPDASRWQGKSVFINNAFGYLPPNQGVATFDALDSTGNVYAGAGDFSFKADELTSQPIRLDSVFSPDKAALSPADSVYLSFYYQPQGVGNAPEKQDTLLLAFKYPTGDSTIIDGKKTPQYEWKTVWKSEGSDLQTFKTIHGHYFAQVMIPITDSSLFYDGFQFRFYNYVSIASSSTPSWKTNTDEWNIDFVYLNRNRTLGDTTYKKLAFSGTQPRFLKNYNIMPYRQYRADPTNATNPNLRLYIANLDQQAHQIGLHYQVSQRGGAFSYRYDGPSGTLLPFGQDGFLNCGTSFGNATACPPVNSLFSLDYNLDTTSYRVKLYITPTHIDSIAADSMTFVQPFYHEFAYDDGTPELGYSVEPAGAKVAYQFNMVTPDTLTAVRMYFNKPQATASLQYFNLMVWSDNNGKPGEVVYEEDNRQIQWSDSLFGYSTYKLAQPQVLSGTFYVGWQQQQTTLNMGFDANDDAQRHIFYYTDNWYPSSFNGALMIRPVFGSQEITTGVSRITQPSQILTYPNPARNYIALSEWNGNEKVKITIYDMVGAVVLEKSVASGDRIDVHNLPNGMYVAHIQTPGKAYYSKIIINR